MYAMTKKSQARPFSIVQPVGATPDPNNAKKCSQFSMNLGFSLLRAVIVLC
jgi:hypothetical protein